jgi:hypothetical protein
MQMAQVGVFGVLLSLGRVMNQHIEPAGVRVAVDDRVELLFMQRYDSLNGFAKCFQELSGYIAIAGRMLRLAIFLFALFTDRPVARSPSAPLSTQTSNWKVLIAMRVLGRSHSTPKRTGETAWRFRLSHQQGSAVCKCAGCQPGQEFSGFSHRTIDVGW